MDNDVISVRNNGYRSDEDKKLSSAGNVGNVESGDSGNSGWVRKGYGLKKWRRIRRGGVVDGGVGVDCERVLKRGLFGSAGGNSGEALEFRGEVKGRSSEGSVGLDNVSDGFGVQRLSGFDCRFAGADLENSEDRSSWSSTAVSAPKMNFGSAAVIGVPREKNRIESLSGKIVGGSEGPRSQQGKGRIDSTKKQRGERVIIENENSRSSIESDPRSSNFLFMQGVSSVSSNGKQSGQRSMNFDGADSTEGNGSGQNNGYGEENAGQIEDLSHDDLAAGISWKGSAKKSENHHTEQEPLMNSILSLQLVQDALEKEIQKFGEVGNDLKLVLGHQSNDAAADFTSTKLEARELSSSVENGSDINRQNSSRSLQTKAVNLTDDVKLLESKLEEARNMLEAKESRVAELETILNLSKSVKEDSVSMQQENCQEFETELEGLFRQRIEVEVEYLAIMNTIQKMKFVALSYNTVVKGNNNQAGEQGPVADKLEEAKGKALELEKWCEDIMGTKEIINVQRKVCKATSCFFIQLILVLLVVRLFILQLKPQSGAFVPT